MRGHRGHRKKSKSYGKASSSVETSPVKILDDPFGDLYGSCKPEVERRFGKNKPLANKPEAQSEPIKFDYQRKIEL